jgi:prevent-host-death family protein
MTTQVNVGEAKTELSRLLDAAVGGDDVVIARAGTPLVRLVPVRPPAKRTLGFLPLDAPDEAFDPLSDEDVDVWE